MCKEKELCKTCRFFLLCEYLTKYHGGEDTKDSQIGYCRRYPPVMTLDDGWSMEHKSEQPIAWSGQWCGEYKKQTQPTKESANESTNEQAN